MQSAEQNIKRPLEIEDLALVEYISSPAVSPDGEHALFVKQIADTKTGTFLSHVYEIPASGGECKRITDDNAHEDLPQYSPCGQFISFLSDINGEKQIRLYNRKKKDNLELTTLRHGVNWYSWSKDGSTIAFDASLWPEEKETAFQVQSNTEKTEWLQRRENSPIVVEDLMYKFDESYGIVDGSYTNIGIVDVASKKAKMLTSGKTNYKMPVFSPDCKTISFYGCPYNDHRVRLNQIFTCNIDGTELKQHTDNLRTTATSPIVFSKEGLIYLSVVVEENTESNGPFIGGKYSLKPLLHNLINGEAKSILPQDCECYGIDTATIGRTAMGRENPSYQLSDCGNFLYFITSDNGAMNLYHVSLLDGKTEKITDGKIAIHSFCTQVNNKIIYVRADTVTMAEVYAFDMTEKTETRLTRTNLWLSERIISEPEEMWVESKDKTAKIRGHILRPAEYNSETKYPAILDIHGGPTAFYSYDYWFEFQYLAARGFAVVYCDPRGSSGYGPEFQIDEHAWGMNSYDDLMTFLDASIEKGFIDENKLGCTGGSYGGRMTNVLVSKSDRFAAAVTQRTLCNLTTSYGTGDMGSVRSDKQFKTMLKMLTDRAKTRSTTLIDIDKVKTPLLILHGTHDYRCSFEQAEQMFIAMKDRNPDVPVKLIAFPGENHNLTRSGKLYFQQAHLKEMADWFELYLKENDNG
ncbi:MAG: S9 family peptidase [Treponema sp.]|nr:S9 family peptidase [Treponema sp.]